MMNHHQKPFWKTKSLSEMTQEEWESLCDVCGRCCLRKLEDRNTGKVYYTNVACRLLDIEDCRCISYQKRMLQNSECLVLTPTTAKQIHWLPTTCAYRLLADGRELKWWHPLVSGNSDTVHEAGISVRSKVISEEYIHPDELTDHIVEGEV